MLSMAELLVKLLIHTTALKFGTELVKSFIGSLPQGFSTSTKKNLVSLEVLKKGVKLGELMNFFFKRTILIGQKWLVEDSIMLSHELCVYPAAFIDFTDGKAYCLHHKSTCSRCRDSWWKGTAVPHYMATEWYICSRKYGFAFG